MNPVRYHCVKNINIFYLSLNVPWVYISILCTITEAGMKRGTCSWWPAQRPSLPLGCPSILLLRGRNSSFCHRSLLPLFRSLTHYWNLIHFSLHPLRLLQSPHTCPTALLLHPHAPVCPHHFPGRPRVPLLDDFCVCSCLHLINLEETQPAFPRTSAGLNMAVLGVERLPEACGLPMMTWPGCQHPGRTACYRMQLFPLLLGWRGEANWGFLWIIHDLFNQFLPAGDYSEG